MPETIERKYEDSAKLLTGLEGWVCGKCNNFWGKDKHMARYCCADDLPCGTDGCDSRVKKSDFAYCKPCLDKRNLERYLKLDEIDWDGEAPLVEFDNDQYFFDGDAIGEVAFEAGIRPWDMKLILSVKESKPTFSMYDFLEDYLCEGQEYEADWDAMDKHVNAWIEKNAPTVWVDGRKRISEKSLREAFPEFEKGCPRDTNGDGNCGLPACPYCGKKEGQKG